MFKPGNSISNLKPVIEHNLSVSQHSEKKFTSTNVSVIFRD